MGWSKTIVTSELKALETIDFEGEYDHTNLDYINELLAVEQEFTIVHEPLVYLFPLGVRMVRPDPNPIRLRGYLDKFRPHETEECTCQADLIIVPKE